MDVPQHGRVILLNGASSSGKTTIVKELQDMLDGCWLHIGVDHFISMWPAKYFALDPAPDHRARQGIYFATRPGMEEPCVDIRGGPLGEALTRGAHRTAAALVAEGFNLVADEVILEREELDDYVAVLQDTEVLFVGVRLPVEILVRRERERGDRMVGLARGHHEQVHAHGIYDLEVDTSVLSAQECAARIKDRLENGPPPDAFQRLRSALACKKGRDRRSGR